jgi:isocitrate dehydrogenase
MDENKPLIDFASTLEKVCVDTVESGHMTKDLAMLVSDNQKWLNTQEFLAKIDENLQAAIS